MNNDKRKFFGSHYLVVLAVLVALVLAFQFFGSYIKIGTTAFSFVLVPIVLGGVLLGVTAGAILGLVFSIVITIMGFTGLDVFTGILLAQAPVGTLITIFLKGIMAGVVPALLYKLIAKRNQKVAIFIAAAVAPIVNTGLFIICMLFMSDVLKANFVADGTSVIYFLVIGCAGINFLVEFAINVVLAPALERVISAISKTKAQIEDTVEVGEIPDENDNVRFEQTDVQAEDSQDNRG